MLRALLDGRLVGEPFEEERQRGYKFRATETYAGLFAAIGSANDGRIPLGPPAKIQGLPRVRARFHDGREASEKPEIPHNRTIELATEWQRKFRGRRGSP